MNRALIAVVAGGLLLSACGSDPFKQFFTGNPHIDGLEQRRVAPAPEDPPLWRGRDFNADADTLYKRGYVGIGLSEFNGSKVDWDDARSMARSLGADAVVVYTKYTNTISGATPLILPNTQTSNTTMTGTAYGAGGTVNAYGNATTTTNGTQVAYVPYSIQRSDYRAVYVVKIRPVFGVWTMDLSDSQRQQIQSNSGVVVHAVADDSPAFTADVLPGDIITRVNGSPFSGTAAFTNLLQSYAGQAVELTISRNGKVIKKKVTLNQ